MPNTPLNVADVRGLFPGLEGTAYLNTANMAVGCAAARAAYDQAVEQWSRGRFDWAEGERAGEEARALFAGIVGAQVGEIALVQAVSIAAGTVAANLPPAKPGENVIVGAREFTSNYFPWLLLRERGYQVRTIGSPDAAITADACATIADGGTRLIAVSAVQSSTGYRTDLAAISRVAKRSGAWLYVDGSQAAGVTPLDVVSDGIDFMGCASYKFLLGSRGMGYLYVRRGLLDGMRPIVAGWKAASRPLESFYGPGMELSATASKLDGSLVWFAALADAEALKVFSRFGLPALLERNAQLSQYLHNALRARLPDLPLWPAANRSTIVSIPVANPEQVMQRLVAANVVASMRAGRIRLSAHFYNLEDEIDGAVALLAGL